MSKNYTQLGLGQRYQIEALHYSGVKQKDIAVCLGVHPATISREIKRNMGGIGKTMGTYRAVKAQLKTSLRHRDKPKKVIFTQEIKQTVIRHLRTDRWSPELISNAAKRNGQPMVSHEWIYQWIWACKLSHAVQNEPYKKLHQYLKHARRRRKRGNRKDSRGLIPNRVSIANRPAVVNKRKRVGDIEVDLMMGSGRQGALLVMTDRATLHTRLLKLPGKESTTVSKGIISCLRKNNYKAHTLTFDNDMAFSNHLAVAEASGAETYFTRPYTSQDKGTVENRIGVLRRFIPKKTDLTLVTSTQVRQIEQKINNRPIRKFNYLNANQMLQEKIALIT